MARKNFRATGGIDIDSSAIPVSVIQETITSNSVVTVDTIALDSFISSEYTITLKQGSKIRTSKVIIQTDGTSVDMTEFGIMETGGEISGVVVSATTASTNAVLQITVTDAETTLVRYKLIKNLMSPISYIPDAPIIGTATAGNEQASVTFTAPTDNGGSSILSYTATSNPGNITVSNSSSPITVTNLTAGTAYTFTVTATNSIGTSAASSVSNEITPTQPPAKAGYFGGGYSGSASNQIIKLLFSNDSTSTLSNTLSQGMYYGAGYANAGIAGYWAGGANSGGDAITTINKILFSNDSVSALETGLSTQQGNAASLANSGTAGYVVGGTNTPGGTNYNTVNKLTFSNDTNSNISATYYLAMSGARGVANGTIAGYVAGGQYGVYYYGNVWKLTFSNDTGGTISATIGQGMITAGAFTNSGTAGYWMGGLNSNGYISNGYRFTFSNESTSTLSSWLSTGTNSPGAAGDTGNAGYLAGGNITGWTNQMLKLTFSNDARSTLSATLPSAREGIGGLSNTIV